MMLMALRKNPSIPAGGKHRQLSFISSLSDWTDHPDLFLNNDSKKQSAFPNVLYCQSNILLLTFLYIQVQAH